jgi:predicted transcriptional regulator
MLQSYSEMGRRNLLVGKNRDRVRIIGDILEAAAPGASKTRIMLSARLSFALLEKYLKLVTESGFVRVEDFRYRLTERGREFLKQYRSFEDRYTKARMLLETLSSEREQLSRVITGNHPT